MISAKTWLDPRCVGDAMLVSVRPINYQDGKRVDEPVGHTYEVVLPEHGYDKLGVKIEGKRLMEAPSEGFVAVDFDKLVVRPYVTRDGRLAYTASAAGIRPKK